MPPAVIRWSLLLLAATGAAAQDLPVLRMMNWSTYIDVDEAADPALPLAERSPTLRAFCAAQRCRIAYAEFDAEDAIEAQLLHQPGSVDLLCCSTDLQQTLVSAGLLLPLDRDRTPQAAAIAQRYFDRAPAELVPYVQPYLAGCTGLLYRKDLVPSPITSWKQYFHPDPALGVGVIAFDEISILWGAAALSAGIEVQRIGERELMVQAGREVASLLRSGRVAAVSADPQRINAALLAGEAALSIQWCGDALDALAQPGGEQLVYSIPDEGGEGWVDSWCLMRGTLHLDLAYRFLDYIASPAVQARLAVELGYECPSDAGRALIADPAWLASPLLNPPEAVRARLLSFPLPHPDATAIWAKLRDE